jgi:hypothetical protein
MFGIAFGGQTTPHHNFKWTQAEFRPMVNWVREQGVCEIGIYTSPNGNSLTNNSWTEHVAPWMIDAVEEFLSGNCSCMECACTNCSKSDARSTPISPPRLLTPYRSKTDDDDNHADALLEVENPPCICYHVSSAGMAAVNGCYKPVPSGLCGAGESFFAGRKTPTFCVEGWADLT